MKINKNNITKYELDNGLVVAIKYNLTPTFSAKVRVNFGRVNEKKGEEGLAHFVEHCVVSGGSKKYNSLLSSQIRRQFGYSNAYTNLKGTFYHVDSLNENFELWLDYISSSLFHPSFEEARVEGERKAVLNEINDSKSDSFYSINKELDKFFYRDHPVKLETLGNKEVIQNVSVDNLKEVHSRGYNTNNMDLIISGGVPDNALELIKDYFGKGKTGSSTRKKFPALLDLEDKIIHHVSAPFFINEENPIESSAQVVLRFVAPPENHWDEYSMSALSDFLGEGENSRLFKRLREKEGLAYRVSSGYTNGFNSGLFWINAHVPSKKIDGSVKVILDEIHKMGVVPVSEDELELRKNKINYSIAKSFETNEGWLKALGWLIDEGISIEEVIDKQNKVTSEDILQVSQKYLRVKGKENYLLCIADPLKENKKL